MALFTCHSCLYEMSTADENIGKSAKCPKCSQRGHIISEVTHTPTQSEKEPRIPEPRKHEPPFVETTNRPQPVTREIADRQLPEMTPRLPTLAAFIIGLTYLVLGIWIMADFLSFTSALANAKAAPQEAAVGAIFSARFIAGYIISRSIENFIRMVVRA